MEQIILGSEACFFCKWHNLARQLFCFCLILFTGDEEEFENDSKVCLGLSVEELGSWSPVLDQALDCQTEEDDIWSLQDQNDWVEIDELGGVEEVHPATSADPPLSVPGVAQETVGGGHAGKGQVPVTVAVLVHQVDGDHEDQRAALGLGGRSDWSSYFV